MRAFTTALLSIATLLAAAPTVARADTYTVDKAHSHIGFKVKHMMVSWVRGQFDEFDATITADGTDLTTLTAEATIQVASIDTQTPKRDDHLRSADFFDAASHPTITFRSTRVIPGDGDHFQVVGDITIRGVTRQVTLDAEGSLTPVTDPWGNTKIGFTATTTLDRQEFGVSWNTALDGGGVVVSDEVHLEIEIEMNLQK